MTALSLIQALIPTTANTKAGTSPVGVANGQGADGATFSLLVPGGAEQTTAADPGAAPAGIVEGAGQGAAENPSTSLIDILSGAQTTNTKDPELLTEGTPEGVPETTVARADPTATIPENTNTAATVPSDPTDGVVPQAGPAASGEAAAAVSQQAPAAVSAAAAASTAATTPEQAAGIKAVAPQAQAAQAAATPEATTTQAGPALQARGDVLEGGQGAPAAQKLLGLTDPKNVSDGAQRDPAAAALASGNSQKNTFGANAANGANQQPFGATTSTQTGAQPAFHEVSTQQLQQEKPEQRLPQQVPPPAPTARFDAPVQTTAAPDLASSATAQSDGALLADQRPPLTVTVRFDQTIQGPQLAAQQLAFHIRRNFANGVNRFEVRLDPPELGRIDVRLDMGTDGRVAAALTVDRPETLDLLQRDARLLQKALEEAGISLDDSSLNFSLRDGNERAAGEEGETGGSASQSAHGDTPEDELQSVSTQQPVAIIEEDRVDIRV